MYWFEDLRSKHEPAHADVQQYPRSHHRRDHGGAAIGEERQRDSDHRKQPDDHPHIDHYMPEEHGRHSDRKKGPKAVVAAARHMQPPKDKGKIEYQDNDRSRQPPLLGKD